MLCLCDVIAIEVLTPRDMLMFIRIIDCSNMEMLEGGE